MATNGRATTNTLKHSFFYCDWQQARQSTSENYTVINWQLGLNCGSNNGWDAWYTNAIRINSLTIDGEVVYNATLSNIQGAGDHQITSGTKTIYHNSDGRKTFSISIKGWLIDYGDANGDGTWELEKIDRYTTVTISERSKDINSIFVDWKSADARDYTQHKINGGEWTDSNDSVASNNRSGYIKISDLNPNTTYKIKVRVRRTDSQLWSESNEITIKTYDYAKFSNITSSNFGSDVNITKINESKIKNDLQVYINNTLVASRENISDDYNLTFTQNELDKLYEKYPVNSDTINVEYRLQTVCNLVTYIDKLEKNMLLTGEAKTSWIKINGMTKRAEVFIKVNGTVKRAVVFVKENGILKRCM